MQQSLQLDAAASGSIKPTNDLHALHLLGRTRWEITGLCHVSLHSSQESEHARGQRSLQLDASATGSTYKSPTSTRPCLAKGSPGDT
jgi:hypothetical protein